MFAYFPGNIKMRNVHYCQKHINILYHSVVFIKETPIQEIFKNTNFEEHLLTAASDFLKQLPNTGEQLLLY